MISGFITVNRKKHNFVIEKDFLYLLPKKEENSFLLSIRMLQNITIGDEIQRKIYVGRTTDNKYIYVCSDNNALCEKGMIKHKIYAYTVLSEPLELIKGIEITSQELEYFYTISRDIKDAEYEFEGENRGTLRFETRNFNNETSINEFTVSFKNERYKFMFSFSHYIQSNNVYPLKITPLLSIGFNNRKNLNKIIDIVYDIRNFLKFISYRNDVSFNNIKLKVMTEQGLYREAGFLVLIDNPNPIKDNKSLETIIKFDNIQPILPSLFEKIMKNDIILNHIPITYEDKNKINYYRYLAVCTSFEAQYRKIYGDNYRYKTNLKFKLVRDNIIRQINKYQKGLTGDKKKYAKSFSSINKKIDTNLQGAMILAFDMHFSILEPFLHYYFSKVIKVDYSKANLNKLCEEIAKTRNYFAHANQNISYDNMSFICLPLVEQLIYAMTLRELGLDDKNIQHIINDIFRMRIALN